MIQNQNQQFWNLHRWIEKIYNRVQNSVRYITLNTSDDTKPVQFHQTMGHTGIKETRDNVLRVQNFGHSTMPTIGSTGLSLTGVAGDQGQQLIIAVEDIRYRPVGLKQGEMQSYMVDGASDKDGSGGTTRTVVNCLKGWLTSIFGKTITIGTSADTTTITITGTNITIKGKIKLDGAVEITGDLTVDGKIADAGDLSIGGTETGGGPT